jgi:hypothetical protein
MIINNNILREYWKRMKMENVKAKYFKNVAGGKTQLITEIEKYSQKNIITKNLHLLISFVFSGAILF